MSTQRRQATLDEVCTCITDGAHFSPRSADEGMPMASVKDLTPHGVKLDTCRRISYDDYDTLVRQGCQPEVGDVLIAKDGATALDTVCEVKSPLNVVLLSSVAILKPDTNRLSASYLRYYLESSTTRAYMKSAFITGAAVPRVVLSDFKRCKIVLPPLAVQRSIAHVLGAYDDLIENNLRRIAILEEMARAIYREWFVEFRYPGYERTQMTESELGLIPEEWQVAELRTVATLIRNSTNPAKNPNARHAHYSIPAFDANRMPAMELGGDIRSTKHIVGDDCVLVSKLNPRIPRVWLPFVHNEYLSISSTEFLVLSPIAPVTRTFLYNLCLDDWFLNGLVTSAYGTSTSHQRVKPEHVMSTAIVLPPAGLIQRFTDMVRPMHELIYTLRKAVLSLRETRDLLLPQLISGELDVSNITIDAEEDNL